MHMALTREQVEAFDLPRIPIKESDKRRKNFERIYGHGATELDALEALVPGELERLVRTGVAPYLDLEISQRLQAAQNEAGQLIEQQWDAETKEIKMRLDEIERKSKEIAAAYEDRLEHSTK